MSLASRPDQATTRFYERHVKRFGYGARDTRVRIRPTLERLFSMTRIGMAVNFLSAWSPTRSRGRLYVQPADLLQYALRLTPAVRLDHSYMPNDFTISLYRTPLW